MYIPAHFKEERIEVLHGLIAAHPLGTLVTLDGDGLNANHIPFEIDPAAGDLGTLRAHVARGNPVWRDLREDVQPLAVFQGPQAYISPSWYASKKETGRVVPTYNYAVVHAHGPLRVIDDPGWLRALLEGMTWRHEEKVGRHWRMEDAPADYIEKILTAVVGIEIPIVRIEGKWKTSQNQPQDNRAGVAAGLREAGTDERLAMAGLVQQNIRLK